MRILVAPGTFKGSLSAVEAAKAMASGAQAADDEFIVITCPVGDGGEGTAEALARSLHGSVEVSRSVMGPLRHPVRASYFLLGPDYKTAALDMASAAGLLLISEAERDLMRATTLGVGELISSALKTQSVERLIIGLGGSATNDGGAGCLQGLGIDLLDSSGSALAVPTLPEQLDRVELIGTGHFPDYYRGIDIILACDVDNPLTGPNGASRVFGPQKGANPEMVERLDLVLKKFGNVLNGYRSEFRAIFGERSAISERPGAGAAGGLGAALMAVFPHARVVPGIDVVLEATGFEEELEHADLVLTGEGRLDSQTLGGKVVHGVVKRCARAGVPMVAIVGSAEADVVEEMTGQGLTDVVELIKLAGSVDDSMGRASELVAQAAYQAVNALPKRFDRSAS